MAKYHFNPATGRAGECRAQAQCPFGDDNVHFDSANDARKAFEVLQGSSWSASPSAETEAEAHRAMNAKKLLDAFEHLEDVEENAVVETTVESSNGTLFSVRATRSLGSYRPPSGRWSAKRVWATVYSVNRLLTDEEGGNGKSSFGYVFGREALDPPGPEGLANIIEPQWGTTGKDQDDTRLAQFTNHPAAPYLRKPEAK